MGIHSKLAGLQLFLADDTFNGHARLALIEHKGLRMEDAPPVFYMGVDSNGRCVAPRIKPGLPHPFGGLHGHHVRRCQIGPPPGGGNRVSLHEFQHSRAGLEFMQRHPIAATWGRSDLASSDMMTMETTKRVWQARLDPRRNTPSIGIYSHVKDRWGIFHAQPFVLNERQAGVAIEGVIRQEKLETSQLAVDTHGYTDFAMSHARLLGFDLCPRLKELKQRHLFVPRGTKVPAEIAAVCEANVDVALIEKHWDSLVHLAASVMSGHASAVAALARFGSAAQGDPIYDAGVQLGRLLRTAFLADYFVKDAFRNELRRVLNRGEAVNALKRAIYTGRVSPAQAKRAEEMQAVADALSLLANIIMAWNTTQMQAVLDRWANRRQVIPAELTGKIAPTRLQGINLRGVFRFPVERYASEILPSQTTPKTGTGG